MIHINNLSFTLPHKICFEGFNTQLHPGARIALIGQNGSGKSSLIKMLAGKMRPSEGTLTMPNIRIGYVPQIIENHSTSSGGERFQRALTEALSKGPEVLLLDEPTNHLDSDNRKSLMRMLKTFHGILIIATHDPELIKNCLNTVWHFDQGRITTFQGSYDDYLHERLIKRQQIEAELTGLSRAKKEAHLGLMHEQERAKKSNARGKKSIENRKWPTVRSPTKAGRANETTGRKQKAIRNRREELQNNLMEIRIPEVIKPSFSLKAADPSAKALLSIKSGCVGYSSTLLNNINFSLSGTTRLALKGKNGSGKSTLVKAIIGDPEVIKSGEWAIPKPEDIGYMDQHYSIVTSTNILDTFKAARPDWSHAEIRKHLNDFLFRKNEEVHANIETLSGGEKARLCLALIAAKPPKLLILDEITNNIDLETRDHIIQVLKDYPGAMIVISHDEDFLWEIGAEDEYKIENKMSSPQKQE